MNEDEYRKDLQDLERESQRSYDTTLITLSSGAIVLSVTYLSQLHSPVGLRLLFLAWIAWGFSLTTMLFSFLATVHALMKGQDELDKHITPTGGVWSKLIIPLNWIAGALFLAGLILTLTFAAINKGGQPNAEPNTQTPTAPTAKATTLDPRNALPQATSDTTATTTKAEVR